MNNYSFYLDKEYNCIVGRESTEWGNFWIDKADRDCTQRILLVGDSTSRMIRSTLARLIGLPVDLFATSAALDDYIFAEQIDAFFKNSQYRYDSIIVQVGTHNLIGKDGNWYSAVDYERFGKSLISLIEYLKQFSNNLILQTIYTSVQKKNTWIKLFCDLNVLQYFRWLFPDKPDAVKNYIENSKNIIIEKVAKEKSLKFIDISSIMKQTRFIHYDTIHYENSAKEYIVNKIIPLLCLPNF